MPASSSDTSKHSKEIHRQGFALGRKILLMVSQNFFFLHTTKKAEESWGRRTIQAVRTAIKPGNSKVRKGFLPSQEEGGCRSTPGSSVLPVWINKSESPNHLKQLLLEGITRKGLKTWLMIKIKRGNINTETYSVYTEMSPALQVTGNTLFA